MSHDHDEHGGHEPRPTGSPKRDAERAATIGGFAGAVLGARGGPIGAGIGGVLGGSTGYILGYAASGLDQPSDDSPETTLDRDHTGDAGHELDDVSHEPDDVGHEPDDDGPVTIEVDSPADGDDGHDDDAEHDGHDDDAEHGGHDADRDDHSDADHDDR